MPELTCLPVIASGLQPQTRRLKAGNSHTLDTLTCFCSSGDEESCEGDSDQSNDDEEQLQAHSVQSLSITRQRAVQLVTFDVSYTDL